jgi:hypothetical protein
MNAPPQSLEVGQRLLLRARAVGLCAELLAGRADAARVARELSDALRELGAEPLDLDGIAAASRLTENGTVLAYETSYETGRGMPGGMTFQMADVAGFYRAFGFEVSGERPDHIVPELEFLALLLLKEAHARITGEADGAEVCATARSKFMAEHLGLWLPSLLKRARETPGAEPLVRLVLAIHALLQHVATSNDLG